MYSLHQRLILSLAASLIVFFLLQTLFIGQQVEHLSEQNLLSRLEHDQEELLTALQWQPPEAAQLDANRIPHIYQRPFSGHYFQIQVQQQTLRSRSLWDETLAIQQQEIARNIQGPDGQQLLLLSKSFMLHGLPIRITIAEDISHIEESTLSFQKSLLLFAGIMVIILLLLQSLIVRYGLKPLQLIRHKITQLEQGEIDQIDTQAPQEIMPLIEEINQLMRLIGTRLQRSRHALADLAHALKTPLAVIGQMIQRQPNTHDSLQMQQQLHLIEQRIESELTRARTAGRSPGKQWHSAKQDLTDMQHMLKTAFPKTTITFDINTEQSIHADREDMLEIFGNLLENACKWSTKQVHASIQFKHKRLIICIEDDGNGIQGKQSEQLLQRGKRADESMPGHGLGLAIVNDIVAAYEGKITLQSSPALGGLQVKISLPQ